jgi:tRNA threonylcarbamoyladenosine biosynthesis protein TsaB
MTRTLVIETATAACSVALIEGGAVIARLHEIVQRGHAERLLPMIAELPDGGRASAILVDVGPGSFTGVRVGIAAARGLAFGWGASVSGVSSLALVAAAAFARRSPTSLSRGEPSAALPPVVAAVLEAGHGEVFMQAFSPLLEPLATLASLTPAAAIEALGHAPAVGNGVGRLLAIRPDLDAQEALPDAADVVLLPRSLLSLPPRPLYGRAPDAKLPAARGAAAPLRA